VNHLPLVTFAFSYCAAALAGPIPTFDSDPAADVWLRASSPFYLKMAEDVDRRGGYTFSRSDRFPKAAAVFRSGKRTIELNDRLKGPERVSVIVQELTNHYQEKKLWEVDRDVDEGRITDAIEYAIMRELIEYDGLKLHRQVLVELERTVGSIPKEMFYWLSGATTLSDYEVSPAYDAIKLHRSPGKHHDYYRREFSVRTKTREKRKTE
jgi:hypothetical protein